VGFIVRSPHHFQRHLFAQANHLSVVYLPKHRVGVGSESLRDILHDQPNTPQQSQRSQILHRGTIGWTSDQFEAVDWDALHWTISKKKLMYSLWLSKQASKFCGTRLQVSRMQEGADDRCPNCHCPEERASHLNLYPSLL
jgi:hypothetical protein